jgi:hypothetical protein
MFGMPRNGPAVLATPSGNGSCSSQAESLTLQSVLSQLLLRANAVHTRTKHLLLDVPRVLYLFMRVIDIADLLRICEVSTGELGARKESRRSRWLQRWH